MKILIVSNEYTKPGRVGNPIIGRIISSLKEHEEVTAVYFCPFQNRLSGFGEIRKAAMNADVIHVQFGGIYAFLVWFCLIGISKPKLLTFHGTDIHAKEMKTARNVINKLKIWLNQKTSFCSILLYDKLGFVSDTMLPYVPSFIRKHCASRLFIQPLGVDYTAFRPMDKATACQNLGIPEDKYVLFSDKSGTVLKRRDIAEALVKELGKGYKLLIMCGVAPDEVPDYINASDFVLLTSDEEGSPNITREALSLNKRVFSVDVGDIRQQLDGLKDSAVISRNPREAAETISRYLSIPYSDNSRETRKSVLDFASISSKLIEIYKSLL